VQIPARANNKGESVMYVIKKLLCWLGFHEWEQDKTRYSAYRCKDCGKVIAVDWERTK
jgi:hypothetical protein